MLTCLAVRSGRSEEPEIIVLRHQLTVIRRQINRPTINDDDRILLGAIAAALPRPHLTGWIVSTRHPAPMAPTTNRHTDHPRTKKTTNLGPDPPTHPASVHVAAFGVDGPLACGVDDVGSV